MKRISRILNCAWLIHQLSMDMQSDRFDPAIQYE